MQQNPKLQQLYLELQLITAQIREQEKQMQALESQLVDMAVSKQSLQEFSSAEKGKEILVPVTNGIFAKATLQENKELLVNIGSGIVVKKTIKDSVNIIEKQFIEMQKIQRQLLDNITEMSVKAQDIEKEINKLVK